MKHSLKYCLALLLFLPALSKVHAQSLTYTTSWIGNSFGGEVVPSLPFHRHVQISADDVFVAPDGTVYTDTGWDEDGYEAGFYREGTVCGALEELSHGWGRGGGGAVTASSRYVYAAMTQSGDDGADKTRNANGLRRFPDPKTLWYGLRRFLRNGRSAPFPTGEGWKNDMCILSRAAQDAGGHYADLTVGGLAADSRRLYVSDPAHRQIQVLDAETLAPLAAWPCGRPGKLALDPVGHLWVLQAGAGANRQIFCLDSRTGRLLPRRITGPAGWNPKGIAADAQGHLLVADSGPDQDIKLYTWSAGRQAGRRTFGVRGGISAAPPGQVGPRRFNNPVGAGMDAQGRLLVYSCGSVAGGGSVIESYAPDGRRVWRLLGLEFIDCAEADPMSETDVFTKEEHFVMDYARPAGQQWTYTGYTVNRFRYPDDPRLHTGATSVFVRRVGGRRFLFTTDMYSGELSVFRFLSSPSGGETAVPAAMFAKAHFRPEDKTLWPAAQPDKGEWLWRDTNGDGQMTTGEFSQPGTGRDAPGAWGWSVDSAGSVWQATERDGLREFPCAGLDARGIPRYSYAAMKNWPTPAPLTELCRAEYVPETDTMYLCGYTDTHPHSGGEWGAVGTEAIRYDHWSRPAPAPALRITLPYDGKRDARLYVKALCIAGNYLFAAESRDPERVFVYDVRTGMLQGTMQPDERVGKSSGWVDTPYGIRAMRRASGEYLIFVEEDLDAKVLLYRWTPPPASR